MLSRLSSNLFEKFLHDFPSLVLPSPSPVLFSFLKNNATANARNHGNAFAFVQSSLMMNHQAKEDASQLKLTATH